MGFHCSITTKPLHITISIFFRRCKEEQLSGFWVHFKHLPLLGLKPFLGSFLYIYTSKNYMEDFYYNNYLFYPITLLTAFSVLTGCENKTVTIHPLITLHLSKDFV